MGDTTKLLREQLKSFQTEATNYKFSTPLHIISIADILTFLTWWSYNSREIISKNGKLITKKFLLN